MSEHSGFPIDQIDLEVLQTEPPTDESLRLATVLGIKLGESYIMHPQAFDENLTLVVRDIYKNSLRHAPHDTVSNFTEAAFAARRYMQERVNMRRHFGSAALDTLDEHERAYTDRTNPLAN